MAVGICGWPVAMWLVALLVSELSGLWNQERSRRGRNNSSFSDGFLRGTFILYQFHKRCQCQHLEVGCMSRICKSLEIL